MKEPWAMRRDEFDLAALPDKQLGKLYSTWEMMYDYTVNAFPDDETLVAYAFLAREVLGRQGSEEANELARFARIRLACTAQGYGLASVESAYKAGKDYPDFHYLVVKRALADHCAVPPQVISDYPDLAAVYLAKPPAPAEDKQVNTSGPLLSDGRPRATLPDGLRSRLRQRHVLVYHARREDDGDERFPCYSDGVLVIRGFLLPHIRHWVAHYKTEMGVELGLNLWEGQRFGVDIIAGETPQACAAILCEHLAAREHQVEIILSEVDPLPETLTTAKTDEPDQEAGQVADSTHLVSAPVAVAQEASARPRSKKKAAQLAMF